MSISTLTAEQLGEDVERREPQLLSDNEIEFDPDWANEPERAGLQRDYRRLSGGYAFTADDLGYIAGLPPHLAVPYFTHATTRFDMAVALEGAHRMEVNPSYREFLLYVIQQCAEEARAGREAEAAVELLPPDALTDEQREHCETTADVLRGAGYRVRVGVWSGNPFAAWATRQLASIRASLNIEEYQLGRTLDAINALPTAGERDCDCGCGSFVPKRADQRYKNAACRKRAERQRKA